MSKQEISHTGHIVSISGDRASVEIVSEPACAACRAAGLCGMAESGRKTVDVPLPGRTSWKVGQEVEVCLGRTQGLKAVFLSYGVPLLVLLILILTLSSIGMSDLAAGLISIGGAGLYYLVLYLFRKKIEGGYEFYMKTRDY